MDSKCSPEEGETIMPSYSELPKTERSKSCTVRDIRSSRLVRFDANNYGSGDAQAVPHDFKRFRDKWVKRGKIYYCGKGRSSKRHCGQSIRRFDQCERFLNGNLAVSRDRSLNLSIVHRADMRTEVEVSAIKEGPMRRHYDSRAYCDPDLDHFVIDTEDIGSRRGPLDSGASISITNPLTVETFQLPTGTWKHPICIGFAGGTSETSYEWADFGGVFGKAAILSKAPDTLFSLYSLIERGLQVNFSGEGVGVYLGSQLVLSGDIDTDTKMFYLDIPTLLKSTREPCTSNELNVCNTAYSSVNHTPKFETIVSPKLIKEVIWLHKRMGHPSRGVMVKNVRDCNWTGLDEDITVNVINKIMSSHQCTACELAKHNRHAQKSGSGVRPTQPGEVISADYQGKIAPVSVRGHTGYYIFKDMATGYKHAILTRDKTSAAFKQAIAHVVAF